MHFATERASVYIAVRTMILVLLCGPLYAAPPGGIPMIHSYEPHSYKASIQNWDIAHDQNGILYFGNNDGILTFDGNAWQTYPLPNRTIVRSVEVSDKGFVYCGGQNDFGRLEPDRSGRWQYRSLVDSIPAEYRDFSDVWEIHTEGEQLFFRSSGRIYFFDPPQWHIFDDHNFQFFDLLTGGVYGQDAEGILYYLEDGLFKAAEDSELLSNSLITGIVPHGGTYLIATESDGLFRLSDNSIEIPDIPGLAFLRDAVINKIAGFENGDLAIGTLLNGLYILDPELRIKFHLHTGNGLLNNNIMSLMVSEQQDLWVGVNKGIHFVDVSSPFTYIKPDAELDGVGYAAAVHRNQLYLGTNNGLFVTEFDTGLPYSGNQRTYREVPGTKGQVWGLDLVDDRLFLSHANGLYEISDGKAVAANGSLGGAWLVAPDRTGKGGPFVGTYRGVYRLQFDSLDPQSHGRLADLDESSRFLEQDADGNIWMAHPYRGVFRLENKSQLSEKWSSTFFGEAEGLPSNLHNHVFFINDKLTFCAEKGVYEFLPDEERFRIDADWSDLFGTDMKIRRLYEDGAGNVWFITEQQVGMLEIEHSGLDRKITRRDFPALKMQMNAGWEFIYPYDEKNIFIASTNGFIHYDPTIPSMADSNLVTRLNEVRATGRRDSVLFGGIYSDGSRILAGQDEEKRFQIPVRMNSLQFRFSAVHFGKQDDLRFRHKLTGFSDEWSEWSADRIKEFTRLRPGNYEFVIEAASNDGKLSGRTSFRFQIKRPWYRSPPAVLFYSLLTLGVFFIFIQLNRRKIVRLEAKVEQTEHRSRNAIQRLEKEKIREQLEHKKRELITSTMHLVHKNETMRELLNKLSDIRKSCPDDGTAAALKKVIHRVELDADLDASWEDLMYHFNEVHEDFFTHLKARYSDLTNKDLKLCAYLRMNLSTKDIALLTNVSHRGIDASRYRLRKKLGLDSNVNLTEFMMQF